MFELTYIIIINRNRSNLGIRSLHRMARKDVDYLVVGAIDLGHCSSSYAVSFRREQKKIVLNPNWTSGTMHTSSYRTATCILLNPYREFDSFGDKAKEKYKNLAEEQEHKNWYFFQHFKMELYNKKVNKFGYTFYLMILIRSPFLYFTYLASVIAGISQVPNGTCNYLYLVLRLSSVEL